MPVGYQQTNSSTSKVGYLNIKPIISFAMLKYKGFSTLINQLLKFTKIDKYLKFDRTLANVNVHRFSNSLIISKHNTKLVISF